MHVSPSKEEGQFGAGRVWLGYPERLTATCRDQLLAGGPTAVLKAVRHLPRSTGSSHLIWLRIRKVDITILKLLLFWLHKHVSSDSAVIHKAQPGDIKLKITIVMPDVPIHKAHGVY